MNEVLIRRAKFSTVGIAIHFYKEPHIEVIGTGFFYDTRGYFLSAAHVLREAQRIQKAYKDAKIIVINNDVDHEKILTKEDFVEEISYPNIPALIEGPTAPAVFDVGIGRIKSTRDQYPFLKIKNSGELQTGEEIGICGFPGGNNSLSFDVNAWVGLRFSPVMQFGHIACLLPGDDLIPYGIQTDIVSIGGSSGSAIISIKTGEVVGLAQKVIPSYVEVKIPKQVQKKLKNNKVLKGEAQVGIIFGDSFNMIADIPNMTQEKFSSPSHSSSAKYTRGFVRSEFLSDGVQLNYNDL